MVATSIISWAVVAVAALCALAWVSERIDPIDTEDYHL